MKKYLTSKFLRKTTNVDNTKVVQSVDEIRKELEIVTKEVEELEKQIRIEETLGKELERQLTYDINKNDTIDEEIDDLAKQKKILIQEIDSQNKNIESLKKTERDLQSFEKNLEIDLKKQMEDFENETKELIDIKNHYKQEYELKRRTYQSLNEEVNPSEELQTLKKQKNGLQFDINSLNNEIQEYKQKLNQKPEIREFIELVVNPKRIIVEMARLNVSSNQMMENIRNEVKRRESNEQNNEMSPQLQESDKSFDIGSDSAKNVEEVSQINVINVINVKPTTSSAPFGSFISFQSPEKDLFGAQNSKASNNEQQKQGFSLFNTQSGTTSPENLFNLFGNQSTASSENGSTFGFGKLFGDATNSRANSPPDGAFNFFK